MLRVVFLDFLKILNKEEEEEEDEEKMKKILYDFVMYRKLISIYIYVYNQNQHKVMNQ